MFLVFSTLSNIPVYSFRIDHRMGLAVQVQWHDLSRLSFKSKLETICAQQTQVFETEIKNVLDFIRTLWSYAMKTAHMLRLFVCKICI